MHHLRRCGRVVGPVAVGQNVDVGIHLREGAAHHVTLTLHGLPAQDGAGTLGLPRRVVRGVVVVDVNICRGEISLEVFDDARDSGAFIATGKDYGDRRLGAPPGRNHRQLAAGYAHAWTRGLNELSIYEPSL